MPKQSALGFTMFYALRILGSLALLFTVACFTAVPVVSAPPPTQVKQPPSSTPPNTKVPNATPPSTPQDTLAALTFTERFTWSISGNTPFATWSPNRGQLAFISDYEKTPANKHKKYIDIADLNTGEMKQVASITTDSSYLAWLNEESLLFSCGHGACGKNKSGVYLLNIKTNTQTRLIPAKDEDYTFAYPLKDGSIYLYTEHQEGKDPNIKFIIRWDKWENSTKSLTQKEGKAANAFIAKQGIVQGSCSPYHPEFSLSAQNGKINIKSNKTKMITQKTIVDSVAPLPKYPGDKDGIEPCFSPELEGLVYYSYDEATKHATAKLMKMSGYIKPEPIKPPEKDMINDMSFTQLFSWSISGNTPIASWSPNKNQLAFISDYPQKLGAQKDGKKYVEVADLKTGAIKLVGTISATQIPLWFDEETLVFACVQDYCGKGKMGVYLLKTTTNVLTQLVSLKASGSVYFFTSDEKLVIFTSENGASSVVHWYQWDPATQKTTPREDLVTNNKVEKKNLGASFCQSRTTTLETFAANGEAGLINTKTSARRAVVKATPMPYFEEDTDGVPPCVSAEVDTMIYYSRDESKSNKATMMKVTGYTKQ
jgi:hypothetical protein